MRPCWVVLERLGRVKEFEDLLVQPVTTLVEDCGESLLCRARAGCRGDRRRGEKVVERSIPAWDP